MYPSHGFPNPETLGDVIICADIETYDFVDFLSFRSQHQYGSSDFLCAKLLADVVSAHAWHHHIQSHQIRILLVKSTQGMIVPVAHGHFKSLALQHLFE